MPASRRSPSLSAVPAPLPMRAALRAARRGEGHVSPNPLVGAALLTPDGRVRVAHHARLGGPHAEARLLEGIRILPRGSTLFVTLEPCAHAGKTPPCVERVIAVRPTRVVIATLDPYLRVRGRGLAQLLQAGLTVELGPGEKEALGQNLAFHLVQRIGRSLFRVKLAASLDGKLATDRGQSRWISGPEARAAGHRDRARADAVLVGSGTVLADDPELTVRHVRGPEPSKIVLDSSLRIDPRCRLHQAWIRGQDKSGVPSGAPEGNYVHRETPRGLVLRRRPRLVLATRTGWSPRRLRPFREAGWEVWQLPVGTQAHVSLPAFGKTAAREGFNRILVEAGPGLAGALLRADLADELNLYLAPLVLGGGRDWCGEFLASSLGAARRYDEIETLRLGSDRRILFRRRGLLEKVAIDVHRSR